MLWSPKPRFAMTLLGRQGTSIIRLPNGWAYLDNMNLVDELKIRVPIMKDLPKIVRIPYTQALTALVKQLTDAYHDSPEQNDIEKIQGWKLFFLLSRMFFFSSYY